MAVCRVGGDTDCARWHDGDVSITSSRVQFEISYVDATSARKATDRRSVLGGSMMFVGTNELLLRTRMSGACGQRRVDINNVRSAKQHYRLGVVFTERMMNIS